MRWGVERGRERERACLLFRSILRGIEKERDVLKNTEREKNKRRMRALHYYERY